MVAVQLSMSSGEDGLFETSHWQVSGGTSNECTQFLLSSFSEAWTSKCQILRHLHTRALVSFSRSSLHNSTICHAAAVFIPRHLGTHYTLQSLLEPWLIKSSAHLPFSTELTSPLLPLTVQPPPWPGCWFQRGSVVWTVASLPPVRKAWGQCQCRRVLFSGANWHTRQVSKLCFYITMTSTAPPPLNTTLPRREFSRNREDVASRLFINTRERNISIITHWIYNQLKGFFLC